MSYNFKDFDQQFPDDAAHTDTHSPSGFLPILTPQQAQYV